MIHIKHCWFNVLGHGANLKMLENAKITFHYQMPRNGYDWFYLPRHDDSEITNPFTGEVPGSSTPAW